MKSSADRAAGKLVLISGAGGGLGSTQAQMFAQQGAMLVLADISSGRSETVAASIEAAQAVLFLASDESSYINASEIAVVRGVGELVTLVTEFLMPE